MAENSAERKLREQAARWIDALSRLVGEYNARKHRTIGMRPIDVTSAIVDKLLNTVYSNVKIAVPARFKVGDPIRTEVFKIVKVQKTNPMTYVLKDSRGNPVAGGFYEYELQRIANPDVQLVEKVIRKKSDKVYVKCLGFDATHNFWIHKNNIL
ncbi:uncharacterized protein [Polyergus mexicanus]|uniref:uncharacterized protein n=1 Tax=Polyergus mexicanus TaxID=615972 RepID=UPI0038B61E48